MTVRHTRLRRIFLRDWDHCGRMFGASWVDMPKAVRFERLRINGQQCVELDLSAFNALAYARHGVPWPFAADDAYSCDAVADRDAWKLITSAMLTASQPLKQWPDDWSELEALCQHFPTGVKFASVASAILKSMRLSPIYSAATWACASMLCTLSRLRALWLYALPVHDALYCASNDAMSVRNVMQESAHQIAGYELPVTLRDPCTSMDDALSCS